MHPLRRAVPKLNQGGNRTAVLPFGVLYSLSLPGSMPGGCLHYLPGNSRPHAIGKISANRSVNYVKPNQQAGPFGDQPHFPGARILLVFGVLLFGLAGRLDWWEAWIFLVIYLAGILTNGLWCIRHNPEMINERGRIGKNAKSWDKVIGIFYMIFLVAIFVIAGLDARFAWSVVPLWAKILGGIGFAFSLAITFWVMTANTFLSTFVRIQDERGHTTVTGGPYRFVRHPMYVGHPAHVLGHAPAAGFLVGIDPGPAEYGSVLYPNSARG